LPGASQYWERTEYVIGRIGLRRKFIQAPAGNPEWRLGKSYALAAKIGCMPAKRAARTIVTTGAWYVQLESAGGARAREDDRKDAGEKDQ